MGPVVALAGGVGAAKLLRGLVRVVPPEDLVVVGNTGDDFDFHGLHVSPDLDIVLYTLAGLVDETKGWGVKDDSFVCLQMLGELGFETWFNLGDKDLAVQIARTEMLKKGLTLSEACANLCRMLGVMIKLLPMSNEPVRTIVWSEDKHFEFQEYFVKRAAKDKVTGLTLEGSENAKPAPGILEAIASAESVVICPSNPFLSIGPILSVPGIRDSLKKTSAEVVAVSPIVGAKALKGPADMIMASLGLEVSAYGVAELYKDFLDRILIDNSDLVLKPRFAELNISVTITSTVMKRVEDAVALAVETIARSDQERFMR
jgi:LPPG:FO 2-phospho-L-lactate transferase